MIAGLCACSSDEPDDPEKPENPDVEIPDDPNKPVEDPGGTVILNIVNDNEEVFLGEGIYLAIDNGNNFRVETGFGSVEICDIGAVAGLGNIVDIPMAGWKSKAAVIQGDGYVIRWINQDERCYARVYVVDYMQSTGGGVMGATVKYQCPFQMPISFDSSSVDFPADGELQQELKLKHPTPFSVKSAPEWISECRVAGNALIIIAKINVTTSDRVGKVVLYNDMGEYTLTVRQAGAASATFAGGSGTVDDPYKVSTASQLDNIRLSPDDCFVLTADIDLSTYLNPDGTGWNPIENFTGTFDGAMHTIKGLWINKPHTECVGLFGKVGAPAVIKRVLVEISDRGISGWNYVAGIVGNGLGVEISQCSVTGNIFGYSASGICSGKVRGENNTKIDQCRFEGTLPCGNFYDIYYNYGISAVGSIWNSYAICTLEDYGYFAGENATANNCYAIANKMSSGYRRGSGCYIHNTTTGYGTSLEDMKKQETYGGWDFVNIWQIRNGESYPTLRCFE